MKRPSKKEIQEAIRKLKEPRAGAGGGSGPAPSAGKPEGKKPNKNRIRKQGV